MDYTVVARTYQTYRKENWEKVLKLAKQAIGIGERLGLPPITFYTCPALSTTTLVSDREWPTWDAMEADYEKMGNNPEDKETWEVLGPLVESERVEFWFKMDLESS